MERQRAPPKGREAKNGSRGIDIRRRIPERLRRCNGRYAKEKRAEAAAVHKRVGRYTMPLYKQAGNSIPVPIFESMFRKILLGETAESEAKAWE